MSEAAAVPTDAPSSGLPSVRIVNAGGGPHDTRVYLNGELVPALRRFALDQKAGDVPVLVLEVYPGIIDLELPAVVLAALDASARDASRVDGDDAPGEPITGDAILRRLAGGVSLPCFLCDHAPHPGAICPSCRDEAVAGTRATQDVCGGPHAS